MTTYWFQIDEGVRQDLIEEDLEDLPAVRRTAMLLLAGLLRDQADEGCASGAWKLSVTARDSAREVHYELTVEGQGPPVTTQTSGASARSR